MPLHTFEHPLIAQALGRLRNRRTSTAEFRGCLEELGLLLAYEATRALTTEIVNIETPLVTTTAVRIATPPILVPVLRAGLALVPGFLQLVPEAAVHHLGLFRNPETLEPVPYYANLPDNPGDTPVYVLDPMLATGNSALAALDALESTGSRNIHLISVLAAPEGVRKIEARYPRLDIYTAALDDGLNDHGYIVPGLGDAGDRAFGTSRSQPSAFSSAAQL